MCVCGSKKSTFIKESRFLNNLEIKTSLSKIAGLGDFLF